MNVLLGQDEYTDDENFLHVNKTCAPSPGLNVARSVEGVMNMLIFTAGGPLNVVVLTTQLFSNRAVGCSTPALYMTNLTIANTLTAIILPFLALSNLGYVTGTLVGCKLAALVYYASCTAGFATVALISVDRYRVIHRRKASTESFKSTYLTLVVTWFIAFMCASPAPIYATVLAHRAPGEHDTCVIFFEYDQVKTTLTAFKILICIIWGVAPVTMMTWFYIFFYRTLRRVSYKRRSRTLVFVYVLLLSFLALQTPFVVAMLFDSYAISVWAVDCANINYRDAVTSVARVAPNFHCVTNPLLYAFLGNDFSQRFRQLLRGELCTKRAFALAQQQKSSTGSANAVPQSPVLKNARARSASLQRASSLSAARKPTTGTLPGPKGRPDRQENVYQDLFAVPHVLMCASPKPPRAKASGDVPTVEWGAH